MKIKLPLVTAIVLLVSLSINAQIDWNVYEDPDGTFTRWSISPFTQLSTSKNNLNPERNTDFRFSTSSSYQVSKVRQLNIFSLFAYGSISYHHYKNANQAAQNDGTFNPIVSLNYTKYFSERRGFFVRLNSFLNNDFDFGDTKEVIDNNSASLVFGKGRLENVAPVYQSIRIYNQYNQGLEQIKTPNQDENFHLARIMRQLDYNNLLDSRMRTIENRAAYLEALDDAGFELKNYYEIANMLDAYSFERPSNITHGTMFFVGIEIKNNLFFIRDGDYHFCGLGSLSINRAINDKWHISNNLQISYPFELDGIEIDISSTLNYFPSARTIIRFNLSPSFSTFNEFTSLIDSNSSLEYFISPQLSWNGEFNWRISNIGKQFETSNLTFNFGFRYYFI